MLLVLRVCRSPMRWGPRGQEKRSEGELGDFGTLCYFHRIAHFSAGQLVKPMQKLHISRANVDAEHSTIFKFISWSVTCKTTKRATLPPTPARAPRGKSIHHRLPLRRAISITKRIPLQLIIEKLVDIVGLPCRDTLAGCPELGELADSEHHLCRRGG